MKNSCFYFDKKIQMCILHSPLQRSYPKTMMMYVNIINYKVTCIKVKM